MTITPIIAALGFALGLWWFSTGAILWLVRRPRASYRWNLAVASVLALVAAVALLMTRDVTTPAAAFTAFTAALAIWGWHEFSFLTGYITGSSHADCPPNAKGWARFKAAAATLMHHEIALAVTALAVVALTLGQANPIGGWTFLVLFAARLSSKLNLFLGAPNFSVEFFPPQLRYLTTYLRQGPVSPLYPISLLGLGLAAAAAAAPVLDPEASAFATTGYALVFALIVLAALEHAFMALPLADTALWRWAMPAADPTPRRVVDAVETSN